MTKGLSVIGPRAITFDELNNYTPEDCAKLLSVPQGITGAWQAGPRNQASFKNGERQRIEVNYASTACLGDWALLRHCLLAVGIDADAFGSSIGKLEDSLSGLSDENRESAADAIKDVLGESQSKPSIFKSLWNILKGINEEATFVKNVAELGAAIAPLLPRIIGLPRRSYLLLSP